MNKFFLAKSALPGLLIKLSCRGGHSESTGLDNEAHIIDLVKPTNINAFFSESSFITSAQTYIELKLKQTLNHWNDAANLKYLKGLCFFKGIK